MAIIPPTRAVSGERIRASVLNELVAAVNGLQAQLDGHGAVFAGASVTITRLEPPDSAWVGSTLLIHGANFGRSIGAAGVSFGGVAATEFSSSSSDSLLKCVVPPIPELLATGSPVEVSVTNSALRSTDSATITVLPSDAITAVDRIAIAFVDVKPQPTAGMTSEFRFAVSATPAAPVSITPHVSLKGETRKVNVPVGDKALVVVPAGPVDAGPGATEVVVRVPISELAAGSVLELEVTAGAGDRRATSPGPGPLTVRAPGAERAFTFTPQDGQDVTYVGGAVVVDVNVQFAATGVYTFELELLPGTVGWVAAFVGGSAEVGALRRLDGHVTEITVTPTDLLSADARPLAFAVAVGSGVVTPRGTLRLKGRRKNGAAGDSLDFTLIDGRER